MITYEFNEVRKVYEIKDFDNVLVELEDFIKRSVPTEIVILSDTDRRAAKRIRTAIRSKQTEVANLRKQVNLALLGDFNKQLKVIEKRLGEEDAKLKNLIDEYHNTLEEDKKTKHFSIKIQTDNEEFIKKIVEICKENKAKYELLTGE